MKREKGKGQSKVNPHSSEEARALWQMHFPQYREVPMLQLWDSSPRSGRMDLGGGR